MTNDKSSPLAEFYDQLAEQRSSWRARNRYYYDYLAELMRFLIPPGKRVLSLGCSTGELQAAVEPASGTGVDISPATIELASQLHADNSSLSFTVGDAENWRQQRGYNYVFMSDLIGDLTDVWQCFRNTRELLAEDGQVVVTYFNAVWEPLLNLGERLGWKMPQ